MNHLTAECLLPVAANLGEGPCWVDGRLWWVDIERCEVHRLDLASGRDHAWTLPSRVGFAIPTTGSHLVVGTEEGLGRFDPGSGSLIVITRPSSWRPGIRFNDAKCDPAGRLWAGTMACDEQPGCGTLYRVDSHWQAKPMVHQITVSNGLAWSPDGGTMYYIDSPSRRVDAFDFRDGEISGRRSVVEIADGFPDGMCLDARGNLWIALWGGWGVACHDPRTGKRLARIDVPVECVTSCCFGPDDELFITCASRDLTPAGRLRQPLAGGLFRARVGVHGPPGEPHLFRDESATALVSP